ncbi:MAG: enoyl-CoA hydratase/isomerase family protein [Verrucomicrobia bacterium]|nr:enoyl-CoA hydratase/isomerase family protein [Verrucomicrobiota bacterium]
MNATPVEGRNLNETVTTPVPEFTKAPGPAAAARQDPQNIQIRITDGQICVLTFDRPDSSANVFDRATLLELNSHLDFVAASPLLKGVVFTSAKPSIFIAGADLNELAGQLSRTSVEHLLDLIQLGQSVFNRVACLSVPTAAAIHGACLGGGYELCLACDFRVASPDRATKVGLPETSLGILPAWGGCTRLPRLIGLPKALDVILGGKILAAKQAWKLGMVDETAPRERLVEIACQRLASCIPLRRDLTACLNNRSNRRKEARINFGFRILDFGFGKASLVSSAATERRIPRQALGQAAVNNRLVAMSLAACLRVRLLKKTRGHYPAPLRALEVATQGISKSVEESLALERDAILELAQTETCRNLVRVFFLQERAKKLKVGRFGDGCTSGLYGASTTHSSHQPTPVPLPGRGATDESSPPGRGAGVGSARESQHDPKAKEAPRAHDQVPARRCAVIGAGVMGAGIAQWLSARGLPVLLRDIDHAQLGKGLASIRRLYEEGVKWHLFTPVEARAGLDRISPAAGEVPFRGVDLVIEAAVERIELKQKIFRRLAELAGPETILATNTSALSVSEIASVTQRPGRVVGLHFFNPVHRMQLVEVIEGRQTDPEVLEHAVRFVQRIGKLPVVVKDSPGFLVNRILMPYLIEAGRLFEAGARTQDIDQAMLDFGMPMGPLRLIDEVGLDVAFHVAEALAACFSDRMQAPSLLEKMFKAGLLGRKSDHGFYRYNEKTPRAATELKVFQTDVWAKQLGPDELQRRMVLLMVNEAARCLEEQIAGAPEDVDFAMIAGTGFAPFRGGPLRYADSAGVTTLVDEMNRLVSSGDTHFKPCTLLAEKAANQEKFYCERATAPSASSNQAGGSHHEKLLDR